MQKIDVTIFQKKFLHPSDRNGIPFSAVTATQMFFFHNYVRDATRVLRAMDYIYPLVHAETYGLRHVVIEHIPHAVNTFSDCRRRL